MSGGGVVKGGGRYRVRLAPTALEDVERHRRAGDRKVLRKLEGLLAELTENPRRGTGKPELLKGDLAGLYSRRITGKHRLVYRVDDAVVTVMVVGAYGHYGDR